MASTGADPGPLFNDGRAGTLRLVGYLVLGVAAMVADHHSGWLARARASAASLTGPLYWLASAPARTADAVQDMVGDRQALLAENQALRERVLLAEARLARLGAVQDQNARLRLLLDARTRLGLKAQLAELVDVDLDPFRHRVLLDSGADAGVRVGQAVMDASGVMGQVIEVKPEQALLILVTDPGHALPVTVLRTGLRTIAYGTGDLGTLRLPHIPFSADVRPGDQLVTSGLGGGFPSGLPVATIRHVEPDDSATFVRALATPSAGMSRSGEVLVLHDQRERLRGTDGTSFEFAGPPELLEPAPLVPAPSAAPRAAAGGAP
jgi:rod shape-determining protein MreC